MHKKISFPLPHKIKEGHNDDFDFTTRSGFMPHIQVNTEQQLRPEDELLILKRLKTAINQEPLKAVDSDAIGDKYTHCNWGLCTNDPNVYPEPRMHIWPYDFMNEGKVAPISRKTLCPMDKREVSDGNGCFYTCRVFKGPKPNKEEALQLVQIKIKALQ